MSTVKISQLPIIAAIDANTANTLFAGVDIPTGATGKMTAGVLARGLYSNDVLNVGGNPVLYPNVAAQFASSSNTYLQINLQNFNSNGSSDFVASTSDSDNANNYVDMGINGKTFNDPIYTSMKPYDAYVYSHGPDTTSYQGNLVIGTASSDANIVFIAGGTLAGNIVGRISKDTFDFLKDTRVTGNITATGMVTGTNITIIQGVDLTQNTNIATIQGVDLTQNASITAAFLKANTVQANLDGANSAITVIQGVDNTQNASITIIQGVDLTQNAAITVIQGVDLTQNASITAAFLKANNAIANTSGVITAGDFNISGNLTTLGVGSAGLFTVNATSYVANTAAFKITGSANFASQLPLNQGYMMHVTGFANTSTRLVVDAFGANAYSAFIGRSARGTAVAPTASQNNDVLLRISGNGWGATGYSQFGVGRIDLVADENYTDTAKGSKIEFWNTITGSNTLNKIATFNATRVNFTGAVIPEKGFIYAANTYPGVQTAIVVDFANNSVLRANTSAGLSVSFANYTVGKVVELWVTNIAGNAQTFTHGCSALASTVNATTYNIPSTSSILAKYMCFNNDAANVFVSIIHA
jgi:hypothetical protein